MKNAGGSGGGASNGGTSGAGGNAAQGGSAGTASDPTSEPAQQGNDSGTVVEGGCGSGSCVAVPTCGDGKRDWDEQCDDGNTLSGDGCSSECKVETGFRCSRIGLPCTGLCGDRVIEGAESCDDGNTRSGDGCSNICLVEPGWECSAGVCSPSASAGGRLDGGAQVLFCGDGIVSGDEECDDGPANSDASYGGCSSQCTINRCGDGILNGTEECDCGDNHVGDIGQGCAVRPTSWLPSYCLGCSMVPDIGP